MWDWVARENLGDRIRFVGKLPAAEQAQWYDRAQWYISLPQSDSVAVSVLEALAHGCIPLLSDLPANRERVQDQPAAQANGWIAPHPIGSADLAALTQATLPALLERASDIANHNRAWVQQHGLFAPAVQHLVATLSSFHAGARHA